MKARLLLGVAGLLASGNVSSAQIKDKEPSKKGPAPFVLESLKKTPSEFLKQFDKNKDGFLDKDELPPFLAKTFERFDRNGDSLLNLEEVGTMQEATRKLLAAQPALPPADSETMVNNLLKQLDTDMDGKISKKEATGKLADTFDKFDKNKDGQLEREELRTLARFIRDNQAGPAGKGPGGKGPFPGAFGNQPDFDALDKNADGRLSRDELKGTRWAPLFTEIDTGGDNQIDRREFEAHLRKTAEKK